MAYLLQHLSSEISVKEKGAKRKQSTSKAQAKRKQSATRMQTKQSNRIPKDLQKRGLYGK